MVVIGITGTLGAGKGTVVEYLVKEKGFTDYSVSGYLRELLEHEGVTVNRDAYNKKANEMRIMDPVALPKALFLRAKEKGLDKVIIESLHTLPEIEYIKIMKGFVIAVDAGLEVRYQRIIKRDSEKDNVTFEKFTDQQARELGSDDINKSNLRNAIKAADVVVENNGFLEELHIQVDEALKKFGIE